MHRIICKTVGPKLDVSDQRYQFVLKCFDGDHHFPQTINWGMTIALGFTLPNAQENQWSLWKKTTLGPKRINIEIPLLL